MREFAGRTAVVTGAAGGIGRGLAERFAREGMRVVLADVEQAALDATVGELQQVGHEVIGVRVDVSQWTQVESLRDRVVDTYGKVHVLCNNAGVTAEWGSTVWETTINDWQWVLGVNLWGVIHGIRAFVPLMIEQGEKGHVINTSSVHGLTSGPGISVYAASKHAVTRISEGLFYDLAVRTQQQDQVFAAEPGGRSHGPRPCRAQPAAVPAGPGSARARRGGRPMRGTGGESWLRSIRMC